MILFHGEDGVAEADIFFMGRLPPFFLPKVGLGAKFFQAIFQRNLFCFRGIIFEQGFDFPGLCGQFPDLGQGGQFVLGYGVHGGTKAADNPMAMGFDNGYGWEIS